MAGYIPTKEADLIIHLNNYKAKIIIHGLTCGLLQPEIDGRVADSNDMINEINQINIEKQTLKNHVGIKIPTRKTGWSAYLLRMPV